MRGRRLCPVSVGAEHKQQEKSHAETASVRGGASKDRLPVSRKQRNPMRRPVTAREHDVLRSSESYSSPSSANGSSSSLT